MRYPYYDAHRNDYQLSRITYPEHMQEIGQLRYVAWKDIDGINKEFFSKGYWIDDLDKNSLIWVISYKESIVASARLSFHRHFDSIPWKDGIPIEARNSLVMPVASMNRLVVHPDFQRRGLSRPLDKARIEEAKKQKMKTIIAEPTICRISVIDTYGFKDYGWFGQTPELPGVQLGFKMLNL